MDSTELFAAFRYDVDDTVQPYLWSNEEVWRYGADAHRMFARLTGGITDVSSDVTRVDVLAGEATASLHPSILRILTARRLSDNAPVRIVTEQDLPLYTSLDYTRTRQIFIDDTPGPLKAMVIGLELDTVRWVQVPTENDTVQLSVYRMPLDIITAPDMPISEVAEEHHLHLIEWMKRWAYRKQDAETFNKTKSEDAEAAFRAYCAQVKAERERKMFKPRIVHYGGI